jgi:NAD(P)-dependent dehydrogenase (short-subunit alcohol dehydrogenase family)
MGYLDDLFGLDGCVAIVTGGSLGLGREMVRGLAACGVDVVITSRNLEACERVAKEIEETTGRAALAYSCDVSDWDQLDGLVEAAYDRFGKVDILINNAGRSPMGKNLMSFTLDMWTEAIDLNLRGPFRLSQLVGSRMVDSGGGAILNISSTGSLNGEPIYAPYAIAKSGLNILTRALAREFAPTVRANCILCGPFKTEATGHYLDAPESRWALYPLKRSGEAREIVGAALYFTSKASSFTTGALLSVDGGGRNWLPRPGSLAGP